MSGENSSGMQVWGRVGCLRWSRCCTNLKRVYAYAQLCNDEIDKYRPTIYGQNDECLDIFLQLENMLKVKGIFH